MLKVRSDSMMVSPWLFGLLLLASGAAAYPNPLEGSGDYEDMIDIPKPTNRVPPDEDILDIIKPEDVHYPEDDDDYRTPQEDAIHISQLDEGATQVGSEEQQQIGSAESSDTGPVRFNLLENFNFDDALPENAATSGDIGTNEGGVLRAAATPEEVPPNCGAHKKLPHQPVFVNSSYNVIRKCCPPGESFYRRDNNAATFCAAGEPWGPFALEAIVAQFYDGCIEDQEEVPPPLGLAYGNPCPVEGGLIKYSKESNDTLFVIQNGSLLVINEQVNAFEVFDGYCLDFERASGALSAYVCPSEIPTDGDIFKGQMVALALCLIFAIPLLLATAYFYVVIPEFIDIHGKALSLNCINFAVALLLESIFQHKTKGNGSTDDTIVLANYAEYFILATFFWLLVNCLNNCIHAWYFLPKGIQIKEKGEKRTFALYAAFAQLVPLAIILLNPPTGDHTALKHYFFIPIIVIIVLNLASFFITFWGFQRVSEIQIQHYILRGRLSNGGEAADAILAKLPNINSADVERVKYMTKYTAMLFVVMAGVWSITIATYYSTQVIPILYDILFGLQGILIFIIFICLPRPFRTVKAWFQENNYCGCHEDPNAVNLRRHNRSYEASNGTKERIPLNNATQP